MQTPLLPMIVNGCSCSCDPLGKVQHFGTQEEAIMIKSYMDAEATFGTRSYPSSSTAGGAQQAPTKGDEEKGAAAAAARKRAAAAAKAKEKGGGKGGGKTED